MPSVKISFDHIKERAYLSSSGGCRGSSIVGGCSGGEIGYVIIQLMPIGQTEVNRSLAITESPRILWIEE